MAGKRAAEKIGVGIARDIRRSLGKGRPLDARLGSWLLEDLGVDPAGIRVHTGPEADRLATALHAEAFTVGADVFFRSGRFSPGTVRGRRLLAHEVWHAVQQAEPRRAVAADTVQHPEHPEEQEAARLAECGHGRPGAPHRGTPYVPRPHPVDEPLLVQCHASWEHRLLGDFSPGTLDTVAKRHEPWQQRLTEIRDFQRMWLHDPEKVTKEQIGQHFETIRTVTLKKSGLLVTYGELNTLPDYMANPGILDEQPKEILLPILQAVRQECHNKISKMLKKPTEDFAGAVVGDYYWSWVNKWRETANLETLTKHIGVRGRDHYYGLLARNACHFAPYSWYRWEQSYLKARNEARLAHVAPDPEQRRQHEYSAWMFHGYADHFLQDSFAAGHLVNKTLIMQWFVDWVKDKKHIPVADWNIVKKMTVDQQPALAGWALYYPDQPGGIRDPETAEDQPSKAERMAMCGVRGTTSSNQEQAYRDYLSFLNSTVVQFSSAALHDHYNEKSVWVTSPAITTPFQLWGDDTMLNGGDGVRLAAETAQMSQQSILDILGSGESSITTQNIRDRFPTAAGASSTPSDIKPLSAWHALTLRKKAYEELFEKTHYYVAAFSPHAGIVSVDQ